MGKTSSFKTCLQDLKLSVICYYIKYIILIMLILSLFLQQRKSEVGDMLDTNSSIVRRTGEFIANARRGNNSGITSHATSSYQLMNVVNRDEGTYLQIHITARDDIGHERHGGGDFWIATLSALSGNFSTAGRIVDHDNGTYSVYFLAAWQEESHVNITLIHPSAAVEFLQDHVWTVFRIRYEGLYKRDGNESQTNCTLVSTSERWDESKCIYSHPLALGNHVFVCDVPDKNLSCYDLACYGNAQSSKQLQIELEKQLITGNEYLFKEYV